MKCISACTWRAKWTTATKHHKDLSSSFPRRPASVLRWFTPNRWPPLPVAVVPRDRPRRRRCGRHHARPHRGGVGVGRTRLRTRAAGTGRPADCSWESRARSALQLPTTPHLVSWASFPVDVVKILADFHSRESHASKKDALLYGLGDWVIK